MSASFGLADRVVMVTGGASGIGLSVVRLLVGERASVALADANIEAARSEASKLNASGARVAAYALDVRDAIATRQVVEAAEGAWDRSKAWSPLRACRGRCRQSTWTRPLGIWCWTST